MDRKMIYNFNEHGLYYNPPLYITSEDKIITYCMNTLQFDVSSISKRIMYIYGFLPLINAKKAEIILPEFTVESCNLKIDDDFHYAKGVVYSYFKFFSNSKKDFLTGERLNLTCDEPNKRILVGNMKDASKFVKTDNNIICGCDSNDDLKGIIIMLDEIIK